MPQRGSLVGIVDQPRSVIVSPQDRTTVVQPALGVGGIAFDADGRVLLIQRDRAPGAGLWSLPGGRVHAGEPLTEACRREVGEETGLIVDVGAVAEVFEHIEYDDDGVLRFHYVVIDYLVQVCGGSLRPSDDARDAGWYSAEELEALPLTRDLPAILARARQIWRP